VGRRLYESLQADTKSHSGLQELRQQRALMESFT
jgi:hypothetical protein